MDRPAEPHMIDQDLMRMFGAFAGPDRPRQAASSGRGRRPLLAVIPLVLVVVAVVVASLRTSSDDPPETQGGLTSLTAGGVRGIPFTMPVAEMTKESEIVFVGTAVRIDGPFELSPGTSVEPALLAYTVTFDVDRSINGADGGTVEVTNTAGRAPAFSVTVGEQYVVFADTRGVGREQLQRLVPVGLGQGVFHVTGPDTAENSRGLIIHPQEIEK